MIRSRTLEEWQDVFAKLDVCVEPVLSVNEALSHPHTQARSMIVSVPHTDGSQQRQVAAPVKMSGHTPEYRRTGCLAGAHTREVLRSAGFSDEEILDFEATGIVQTS